MPRGIARASTSIAIVPGKQTALRISAGLFGLVVALSVLPIIWGGLGLSYLLPIALMDLLIIFFVGRLLRSRTPAEGRWARRGLYLSASLGLLAFLMRSWLA
jgi:geranylgeranylglycerol-phosphate geranylgeranyltransferase